MGPTWWAVWILSYHMPWSAATNCRQPGHPGGIRLFSRGSATGPPVLCHPPLRQILKTLRPADSAWPDVREGACANMGLDFSRYAPRGGPLQDAAMRLWLAIRCFTLVLFNREFRSKVEQVSDPSSATPAEIPPRETLTAPGHGRSDAIALLAALQREARFVDLVSESLDSYSDAQIGAAARGVLADCGKVLKRVFALEPVANEAEGATVEVPAGYDTGRLRLSGNLSRQPPLEGTLVHGGWVATQCEVATWSGSPDAALVVAPAEIEVR